MLELFGFTLDPSVNAKAAAEAWRSKSSLGFGGSSVTAFVSYNRFFCTQGFIILYPDLAIYIYIYKKRHKQISHIVLVSSLRCFVIFRRRLLFHFRTSNLSASCRSITIGLESCMVGQSLSNTGTGIYPGMISFIAHCRAPILFCFSWMSTFYFLCTSLEFKHWTLMTHGHVSRTLASATSAAGTSAAGGSTSWCAIQI